MTRGDRYDGRAKAPTRWPNSCSSFMAFMLATTVARLLREAGYSLQAPRKTVEGAQHPDRNEQFVHINAKAEACLAEGIPFISVDTKKKELVGNFKNGGREWQPGAPELVDVHDFPRRTGTSNRTLGAGSRRRRYGGAWTCGVPGSARVSLAGGSG